jgi:hypothetical protein
MILVIVSPIAYVICFVICERITANPQNAEYTRSLIAGRWSLAGMMQRIKTGAKGQKIHMFPYVPVWVPGKKPRILFLDGDLSGFLRKKTLEYKAMIL